MNDIYDRVALSPSKESEKHAKKMDRKRQRDAARKSSPAFKRRRGILKENRQLKQAASELREGELYASRSGMP